MAVVPELWQEVLDTPLVSVISSMDRMIQFRYLNQKYYTLARLFRMHKRDSEEFHKCKGAKGTFIHMVWECPRTHPLWSRVTELISDNFCSPLHCLLGVFDQEEVNVHTTLFLRLLYFGAKTYRPEIDL